MRIQGFMAYAVRYCKQFLQLRRMRNFRLESRTTGRFNLMAHSERDRLRRSQVIVTWAPISSTATNKTAPEGAALVWVG